MDRLLDREARDWIQSLDLVTRTSTGNLREQLKSLQPWSLDACVLSGSLWPSSDPFVNRAFSGGNGASSPCSRPWDCAHGVSLRPGRTAFLRRTDLSRRRAKHRGHETRRDVQRRERSDTRLRCASGEYNKQPYAYPHALSLAYRMGGSPVDGVRRNAIAMAMTICAVYLWCAWHFAIAMRHSLPAC